MAESSNANQVEEVASKLEESHISETSIPREQSKSVSPAPEKQSNPTSGRRSRKHADEEQGYV